MQSTSLPKASSGVDPSGTVRNLDFLQMDEDMLHHTRALNATPVCRSLGVAANRVRGILFSSHRGARGARCSS